jgi:PEP-CTERM motif
MMKHNLVRHVLSAGFVGSLAFAATQVAASPYFSYDASGLGGAGTTFYANAASGTSSEHLFVTGANKFAGEGWVQVTALTDNSADVPGSGYGVTGLYAKFTLGVTLATGTFGLPISTYVVDSFTFSLFHDTGIDNVFTQANANALTLASIANTAGDVLLGSGSLNAPGFAFLSGKAPNQVAAGLNVSADFALTSPAGEDYFFDPSPFYDIALAAFTSTGGAWQFNQAAGLASIGNAAGVVDFEKTVPEPGTLLLVGAALLGLGFVSRRKV